MDGKDLGICIACFAAGAIGGALLMRNKEKIKPATAALIAKSMKLKEKAKNYAARAKEQAEDIVAEAKHLNEKPAQAKSKS